MPNTRAFQTLRLSHLPGALAHGIMTPQPPLADTQGEPRSAAVLVLLSPLVYRSADAPDELFVTLIRRTGSTHHSHELAFPGGLRERSESLRATALREAREEIGVKAGSVKVLGTLSTVRTATSRTDILPVLAIARHPLEFRANAEVAALIHVPLGGLSKPGARGVEIVKHPEIGTRRIPYFAIGNAKLWGVSAKIMAELLAVVYGDEFLNQRDGLN